MMDPKHAIRFSISVDKSDHTELYDDFKSDTTTDSIHYRFATVDFERLCAWVAQFGGAEFNLTMDLELRNTAAVRRFLHCWTQLIAAEGIDNRWQADFAKPNPEPKQEIE